MSLTSPHAASAATHALDLSEDAATTFTTRAPDRGLGSSVAAAGDVNGDGIGDVVIGAPDSGRNGRKGSGSAYVVFGSSPLKPHLPLDPLGESGFRIDGAPPEVKARWSDFFRDDPGVVTDSAGFAVAGIGDVNGDGLGDVAVSAPNASPGKRLGAGAVYVVFGKRSTEPVDLKGLGAGGYRIAGERKGTSTGFAMAAAGDVNGDGRGDLLVGTFFFGSSFRGVGNVYVVFSHPEARPIDLANFGADGIAIRSTWPAGAALAALGDVNGDGLGDIIVGRGPATKAGKGHAYVVFGREAPGEVRLKSLGSAGYSIRDSANADTAGNLGGLVGGPGDVNGDGRPDLLVGGGNFTHVLFSDAGREPVDLAHSAGRSVRIGTLDIGIPASSSGDANGDGLADVLLADSYTPARCRQSAGSATVVYGRSAPGTVRLSNLGAGGYAIDGAGRGGHAGAAVNWAGDLDRDGRSDVLIGAPDAATHGRAYLVTGRSGGVPTPPPGPCIRVMVPPQSLGRVVRTRRLRVSVTSRSADRLVLTAVAPGHHEVAAGLVTFREPGTKRARLTLNAPGRRMLAKRDRVRIRVVAEAFPFAALRGSTTTVLRR